MQCPKCNSSNTVYRRTLVTEAKQYYCRDCNRRYQDRYILPQTRSKNNSINARSNNPTHLDEFTIKRITKLRSQGVDTATIALRLGLNKSTVEKRLKRLGLTKSSSCSIVSIELISPSGDRITVLEGKIPLFCKENGLSLKLFREFAKDGNWVSYKDWKIPGREYKSCHPWKDSVQSKRHYIQHDRLY